MAASNLNETFIEVLERLSKIMMNQGEVHRARAYQKAQETIMTFPGDIVDSQQLKGLPAIGSTILEKLAAFQKDGTLAILERERANPAHIFADIYGVGPKKAKELVAAGITTIAELRERQYTILNKVQRVGLRYYEDIQERIPRSEIDQYKTVFSTALPEAAKMEIVGSYRRGAQSSGDIDVILTSQDSATFATFIDALVKSGVILEILSRGPTKCLVVGKLPGPAAATKARRIDFLYTTPQEYAFAVLYFTGSKTFNTVMRARALVMGYSLNEHELSKMDGKKKGAKVDRPFKTERDIFDFLKMEYKEPAERIDGRAVVSLSGTPPVAISEDAVHASIVPILKEETGAAGLVSTTGTTVAAAAAAAAVPVKKTRKIRIVGSPIKISQTAVVDTNPVVETNPAVPAKKNKTLKIRMTSEEKAAEKAVKAQAKEAAKAAKAEAKEAAKAVKVEAKEAAKAAKAEAKASVKKLHPTLGVVKTKKIRMTSAEKKAIKEAKEAEKKAIKEAKEAEKKATKEAKDAEKKAIKEAKTTKKNHIKTTRKYTKKNMIVSQATDLIPQSLPTPPIDPTIDHAIQHFKQSGITVLEGIQEDTLSKMLTAAQSAYHNETLGLAPLLTDGEYDVLKGYVERRFTDNMAAGAVGAPIAATAKAKVRLPYEMWSMDKIKPDSGALGAWTRKYPGPYVLSYKLDGVSGLYTTEGPTPKLYTRGDGKVGQDISHLIPYLNLPTKKDIVVRGEFIMPKSVFTEKYATAFANPRNLVAGLVNRLTVDERARDLHFVTYEVVKPVLTVGEQMTALAQYGFETVGHRQETTLTNEMLSTILVDWRHNGVYEADGVIVADDDVHPRVSGNPEHAFAFKMALSEQMAEAKVVDVLWTASKDGFLKPRVRIEPIRLSGVTIEYATGFNAAFIETNRIGLGATIEIIRSGDVIPYIRAIVVPAERPMMPQAAYHWNETHVDIVLDDKEGDQSVREKNITGFFRGIEVDGLSAGNVTRLMKAGFDTVPKVVHATKADLMTVEGFQEKTATKLYDGIRAKLAAAPLAKLMAASNLFGRGFSDKKIGLILESFPDILTSSASEPEKVRRLAGISGMATKTAEAFVPQIPVFLGFLGEIGVSTGLDQAPSKPSQDTTHPLYKKTVVFSGFRDKGMEAQLAALGAKAGSSVSKTTFAVVTTDKESGTGKVGTAKELGVGIYTPDEFRAAFL